MSKSKMPETSKAAFRSLDPEKLNERYSKILAALGSIKEGTYEQIARAAKLDKSIVWRRLSELAVAGLIYRPGNKRKLSSKREGFTWMLTGAVTEEMQQRERALDGESVADHSRKITTIVREHKRKTQKLQQPEYTNKLF